MVEFVNKVTPNTQLFEVDYNSFDFDPKTGSLVLKFGRLPPVNAVQTQVNVDLDAVVEVGQPLSVNFIAYMVKLAKAIGMDLEEICKSAKPPAIGPNGKKNH
ncbi:hypothetical protein ACVIGB_000701 [Bradyrhizobium sp. USDA 4341]